MTKENLLNKTKNDTLIFEKNYYGYKIDHTSYTEIIRESNPDEEYSGEDTQTNWFVNNELTIDENYPDITTSFELNKDKEYFLVYVIYNTGDSFSRNNSSNIEFIDIFEDLNKANLLVKQIYENTNMEQLQGNYLDEKNNKKNLSFCWIGHFESISLCEVSSINVQSLNLNQKIKTRL